MFSNLKSDFKVTKRKERKSFFNVATIHCSSFILLGIGLLQTHYVYIVGCRGVVQLRGLVTVGPAKACKSVL